MYILENKRIKRGQDYEKIHSDSDDSDAITTLLF